MKLIGLMPCRNEDWVLGLTARAALMWCDELILWLHSCTDGSRDIAVAVAHEHPGRVIIDVANDPTWAEMSHREQMLELARERGATHIAMVDADEILTGNLIGAHILSLYNRIKHCGASHIFQIPLYNLRHGISQYHANGLWGNRIVSVAFADDPALHWAGDRFHHREPMGKRLTGFTPINQGDGGVMHLWGSSVDRCRAKHRLYRITERIRWPDKDVRNIERTYSQWEKGGLREDVSRWTFKEVPVAWWSPYEHLMKHLDIDRPNWQDAECERLIAQHGRDYFRGLSV